MLTETAVTSERLISAPPKYGHVVPSTSTKRGFCVVTSSGFFLLLRGFRFCACVAPFLVRDFWEFLHFFIFVFNLISIFFFKYFTQTFDY